MATHVNWNDPDIANQTLGNIYQQNKLNNQSDIPFIIRLLENPTSPVALPGKISLHNHDCLHIILGIGVSPQEEAFIIGFTMGNDDRTKQWHVKLFKFFSRFIYPAKYQFTSQELDIFNQGFEYGKKLRFRNLNQLNFEWFYDLAIQDIRAYFGVDCNDYLMLRTNV